MNDYSILIIDDNESVRQSLKLVLKRVFKIVATAPDPHVILGMLQNGHYDVVLLDMNFDSRKLDGEEGLFWLNRIKEEPNAPAVVLITAFGDIDLAVRSVQQGAEDFITKPWSNDVLISKLEAAIQSHKSKMQTATLAAQAQALVTEMTSNKELPLEEIEKKHILEVIDNEGGNLVSAANKLQISRQTLYNKLKKYGIIV